MKNSVRFIVGPTAIGKSSLAIRLAKKIKGEIINADSMQVYSNLRVLTARPSEKDHKEIPHHLYGYVKGSERYNVSKWCFDIQKKIQINEKKNVPSIVVGGSGMYIDTFINGLIDLPPIPEYIKKKSKDLIDNFGIDTLIEKIKQIDLKSFRAISPNDISRLRRIWEIHSYTGKRFSDWQKNKNNLFIDRSKCNFYLFLPSRENIYNQVNSRFHKMIEQGAIEEVKALNSLNLDRSLPIMRAHGVPEILDYLNNNLSLEAAIEKGQQVTRNYVKRQFTWWKSSMLPIHRQFNKFPNEIDENLINF